MVSFAGLEGLDKIVESFKASQNPGLQIKKINPLDFGGHDEQAQQAAPSAADIAKRKSIEIEKEEYAQEYRREADGMAREAVGQATHGVNWNNVLPDYYRNLPHDGFNAAKDRLNDAVTKTDNIIQSVIDDPNATPEIKERILEAKKAADAERDQKLQDKLKLSDSEMEKYKSMDEKEKVEFLGSRGADALNARAELEEAKNVTLAKQAEQFKNAGSKEERDQITDDIVTTIAKNENAQNSFKTAVSTELENIKGIKTSNLEVFAADKEIEIKTKDSNGFSVVIKIDPKFVEKNGDGISLKEGVSFKDAVTSVEVDFEKVEKDKFFKENKAEVSKTNEKANDKSEFNDAIKGLVGSKGGEHFADHEDPKKRVDGNNISSTSKQLTV